MKFLYYFFLTILLFVLSDFAFSQTGNDCSYDEGPFYLVFHDDFNGSSLDLSKWSYETGCARNCNYEFQQ